MNSTHSRTAGAIAAVSISTLIASAGAPTHNWLSSASGDWNDDLRWDVGFVPDSMDHAHLGLSGAYTVSLPVTGNALELTISNPDVTFEIENSRTMNIFGDLSNEGLIIINPIAGGSGTYLDFEADAQLTGSGLIRLNANTSRSQIRTGAGVTLTQGLSHTIEGYGQISGSMLNNGTVDANALGGTLLLSTNTKANNSLLRASMGGILEINGIDVNQGTNGTISAEGAGSIVDFNGATITGGNLQSIGGGLLEISAATFDGVDFVQGQMHVPNSRTLDVFNSITNDGVITVNPVSGGSTTSLDFENTGSFLGSGEVVLNGFGSRARLRTGDGVVMTNSAAHTIHGWGQIESDLINDGTITADVTTQELVMNINAKANNAIMQATNGGILDFAAIPVTQSVAGVILADGVESRVDFNSTEITGGQINASNGGSVDIENAIYNGVTISGPHNVENSRTLDVYNSIVNNGTITVNPDSFGSATQLDFENSGSFLGSGQVILNSFDARARLRTAAGATMTNSATHTIRGFGRIEANLINDGLVLADSLGNAIHLNTENKVNNGSMEAINGAELDFSAISVDQSGGGQIIADGPGAIIDLGLSSIISGDLMATNGALVDVSNSALDSVNFDGLMHVENATSLDIFNSIINNGTIVVNPNSFGSATNLDFENDATFLGNGEVVLNSFDARANLRTPNGDTMTNGASHTIHGYGSIDASLVNNGVVRADEPNNAIFLSALDKQNNATMTAVNEAELDFDSITVTQGASGQISANGMNTLVDLNSNTTIINGQLGTNAGGTVEVTNATLDGVDCNADIGVTNSASMFIRNGVTNDGSIIVNMTAGGSPTSLTWHDDSQLGGSGRVVLNASNSRSRILVSGDATMATLGENQRLEGIGSIQAPFTNHGTTAPGMSAGTMLASQPVFFSDSSVFEAEVNTSSGDLLDSTSTIELDGTLNVVFIDGFVPVGFWARTIMEGSSITGKFDAANIPAPPGGLVTRVLNTGTELRVGQTCAGDVNLDGLVNFFDVSQFLADFAAESPDADLNNDNQWNFFDVSVFLTNFGMGC